MSAACGYCPLHSMGTAAAVRAAAATAPAAAAPSYCCTGGSGAAAVGDGSSSEPVANSSASGTNARGNSRALLEWLKPLALVGRLAADW
jgi:hypothetical protein